VVHRSIRCLSHGAGHCIAVSDTGVVFTWGAGVCGQLGHNEQVYIIR
jgi:alpha-tubulin suppressor-like RCC1 family protein